MIRTGQMKDLLKKIDGCLDISADEGSAPSTGAEYPAMFLYVGDKAAESCPTIKKHLKRKLMNGGSVIHAVMGADCADADLTIDAGISGERANAVSDMISDSSKLAHFNAEVRKTADRLMMTSGFPQMTKCFLFIITYSDSPLNAVLPEFVMLFSEYSHIRVYSYLFVQLSGEQTGYVRSAAFFGELEDCQKSDFLYEGGIMMREGQRINVRWDGEVFGAVFFLEMYRSDMKYSPHNAENNALIAALIAVLRDRDDPVPLPPGTFFTAGVSAAHKPVNIIAHFMFKSLIDILTGLAGSEPAKLPIVQLLGYEVISEVSDRIMLSLPPAENILSVLPKEQGGDPDKIRNTNVRNILEYFGGADEEYFTEKYVNACMRMADCCDGINISDILAEYVNKGTLHLSGALGYLGHDGEIAVCLGDVLERIASEEETLTAQLDTLISQPCPDLSHGLFSKPTGCEVLASAVSLKYGKKLLLLKLSVMKRLISNINMQMKRLHDDIASAVNAIRSFSEELNGEILGELYDDESTLTDASAFIDTYTGLIGKAYSELEHSGGLAAILRGRELYGVLMSCGKGGRKELTDIAFDIYKKLMPDPSVREVFALPFDAELYERYRNFDGGKDRGWVDAQLERRLTDACKANLRYSVFQPNNSMFCMGNAEIGFVKKMLAFENPGFNTVNVGDVRSASYEQLAVYNIPSADSITYVNESRKVYDGYVSANGDNVYIARGTAAGEGNG